MLAAPAHESLLVESPILVAVAAEPASTVVMPFVSKPDRDAVVTKGPDFLDQTVVQLLIPLACQESLYGSTALKKLRSIAPDTVE